MSSQAALGQKAIEAKDYSGAIKHLTEALKSSNSPLWLTQRSTAYQRIGSHELALYDAEDAVLQAMSRGRRELIAAAQLRRAIALYSLGRYGDARICFIWVRKLNEKEKGLGMWQAKVVAEFEKLDEDADGRKVTIKEVPDKVDRVAPVKASSIAGTSSEANAASAHAPMGAAAAAIATATAAVQTPKDKIRHEWYQSSSKVTITIFAKNVPKDKAEIEFGAQSLDVTFPTSSGSNYDFALLPTFSAIDTSQSTYSIMPSKIEVNLHKAVSGLKWAALEGAQVETNKDHEENTSTALPQIPNPIAAAAPAKAPAYPTSSRTGTKNWDVVAQEALKKEKKAESKNNGAEPAAAADDDDLDDEGDALQGFFKKIYKDANPDTRRAMMKSYVESNGTALSTNWEDVGQKTVPVNPPDGIEAKKWES